jgi:hypothetical protein
VGCGVRVAVDVGIAVSVGVGVSVLVGVAVGRSVAVGRGVTVLVAVLVAVGSTGVATTKLMLAVLCAVVIGPVPSCPEDVVGRTLTSCSPGSSI